MADRPHDLDCSRKPCLVALGERTKIARDNTAKKGNWGVSAVVLDADGRIVTAKAASTSDDFSEGGGRLSAILTRVRSAEVRTASGPY